jgi:hypothetical protein
VPIKNSFRDMKDYRKDARAKCNDLWELHKTILNSSAAQRTKVGKTERRIIDYNTKFSYCVPIRFFPKYLMFSEAFESDVEVPLRLTVSLSVHLGIKPLPGTNDQIVLIISHHTWFFHQASLRVFYRQSHLIAKQENYGEEMAWPLNLAYEVCLLCLCGSLTCTIFDMRPKTLLPLRISRATYFIALKNPLLSAWFEPADRGSNSKHDNYYTKNDSITDECCKIL